MSKTIGVRLSEPSKPSDHPTLTTHYCSLDGECPFLVKHQCVQVSFFSSCIHGSTLEESGPTKRAKSYYNWIKEARSKKIDTPNYADEHMAILGEWIYLPYAHMDLCEHIPFFKKRHIMSLLSSPFIKMSDFTADVVVAAYKYDARAMFGGSIPEYQKLSLPLFLYHLKHTLPGLYQEACEKEPGICDKTLKSSDIKFMQLSLSQIGPNNDDIKNSRIKNLVVTKWDGEFLELEGNMKDLSSITFLFKTTNEECFLKIRINDPKSLKVMITDKSLIAKYSELFPYNVMVENVK